MFKKLVSSVTFAVALIFGASLISSPISIAAEKGNPSDCAKFKDIDEKKACHEKALEALKDGKNSRDTDDDKDKKKGKKGKKDKTKKVRKGKD